MTFNYYLNTKNYIFLFIILFSVQFLNSQTNSSSSKLGVAFNFNSNIYKSNFITFPGLISSNPGFTEGKGSGYGLGLFFVQPLSNTFDLTFRANYLNLSGQLLTNEPQVISIDGTPINAIFKHTLDAKINSGGFDLLVGIKIIPDLRIVVGGRVGILLTKSYEQVETLVSSDVNAIYKETGNNTRNYAKSEILNPNSMLLSAVGGLQYDINFGSLVIIPEIFYDMGISSISKDVSWKASSLRGGIAFAYSFGSSSSEKTHAPEPKELKQEEKKTEIAENKSEEIASNPKEATEKPIEKNEEPKVEEKIETPKAVEQKEEPKVEDPKFEAPKEESKVEETKAEEKKEEPKVEEKVTKDSKNKNKKDKNNKKSKEKEAEKANVDVAIITPKVEEKPIEKVEEKKIVVEEKSSTSSNSSSDSPPSTNFLRNSITIVPAANKDNLQYNQSLIRNLNKMGSTGRYDYNLISDKAIMKFQKEIAKSKLDFSLPDEKNPKPVNDSLITEGLKEIIRKSVLESILEVGTSSDSAAARFNRSSRRLVTSAKAQQKIAGLTASQEIEIINNTFIGVEILQSIKNNKEDVDADGYYYWFNLSIDNNSFKGENIDPELVTITLIAKDKASASSSNYDAGKFLNKEEQEASNKIPKNEKAVNQFVDRIQKMAQTMEQFKLKAVVQSAESNYKLDIGNREDIYLDLGFKVYEPYITAEKKIKQRYVGFVRIEEIGDNNTSLENMSTAYGIIPGGIEQGNIATSYDQLFDLYVRPNLRLVNIPAGVANWLFTNPMMDGDASSSLNIDIGAFYNIAKFTKQKQLFAGINISIGFPSVATNPSTGSNFSINPPMTIEANLAVMKKFWFSRLNVSTELNFGVNTFSLSGKSGELDWEVNTGMSYGLGLIVGAEYAFNPDINFGLDAGFRYVLPTSEIVVKVGTKETTYPKDYGTNPAFFAANGFNDLNLGGLRLGLRFSYSLPPLF